MGLASLTRKYIMAFAGLFLCLFLVGHLIGNLQLLITGEMGKTQFNEYAKFMTTFPGVKILSYLTYFSILAHTIMGLILTIQNNRARKHNYAHNNPSANSIWSSRNMGILGTIILVFIIIHLQRFWYQMHWGDIPQDVNGNVDLHEVVILAFQELWYVILYVISMAAIGFHLYRGFQNGFQSLGIRHPKYTPVIQFIGRAFAIVVPLAFAIIPVYIYIVF